MMTKENSVVTDVHPSSEDSANKDPFDPANIRMNQNFGDTAGVKKVLNRIPVRKPGKQTFVRTHPDEEYRVEVAVIELEEDKEIYLLHPELVVEFPEEWKPVQVVPTIDRQGNLTLWPLKLPKEGARTILWHESAIDAAEAAKNNWVRVQANMSLGAYDIYESTADLPDPEWPDLQFSEMLRIAFQNRYIQDVDHPVIQQLRGMV